MLQIRGNLWQLNGLADQCLAPSQILGDSPNVCCCVQVLLWESCFTFWLGGASFAARHRQQNSEGLYTPAAMPVAYLAYVQHWMPVLCRAVWGCSAFTADDHEHHLYAPRDRNACMQH